MIRTIALAGVLATTLIATAQAQAPQIPTPVNPRPANPIATDGSPLPLSSFAGPGYGASLQNGRSVGLDGPLAPVGGIVGGGLGLAGSAIESVGQGAGSVVNGNLGGAISR